MRPVSCPRATYQRRQPEQTVLYRAIATHLPTFLARTAGEDGTGWPAFVRREFEAYLKCGRLGTVWCACKVSAAGTRRWSPSVVVGGGSVRRAAGGG